MTGREYAAAIMFAACDAIANGLTREQAVAGLREVADAFDANQVTDTAECADGMTAGYPCACGTHKQATS
jgi:hypothetical protein